VDTAVGNKKKPAAVRAFLCVALPLPRNAINCDAFRFPLGTFLARPKEKSRAFLGFPSRTTETARLTSKPDADCIPGPKEKAVGVLVAAPDINELTRKGASPNPFSPGQRIWRFFWHRRVRSPDFHPRHDAGFDASDQHWYFAREIADGEVTRRQCL
jgi:hypothetical protein